MRVKEVVDTAMVLLRIEDATERERALLLRCFNLVYSEIACDYIELKKTERARSSCGRVDYCNLSKSALNIISVESGGVKQKFEMRPSYFTAPEGEVTVTYTYLPDAVSMEDDIEYGARLSAAVLAYGVAAEYALLNSDFEQSQMWDKRYRDGVISAARNRREMRIPKRGWY